MTDGAGVARPRRFLLIAGEASGDLLGAGLIFSASLLSISRPRQG